MKSVLYIGQDPKTVDFSDPGLPPGLTSDIIQAGIDLAERQLNERGWQADLCMFTPDEAGLARLTAQLSARSYDCVVIGGGLRMPARTLPLFETVLNAVHAQQPNAAIAFNTRPDDTADAAARWIDRARA